ncbi:hypothetical protein BpHYR1_013016 [Brachionus plicatilis]|uniref:Uncharacterized protein n=1 Tax=Brachionus plicatilis TaxID=10195 RepID=A0A3M7R1G7_BRAPC|nr:hypothetical protein BpHYR1_013016 [Brachionus plicatilis]
MILCGCFYLNTLTKPYETYAASLLVSNRLELTFPAGSDYRVTYSAALRSKYSLFQILRGTSSLHLTP